MMIRLYSLLVLLYDIVYFSIFTFFSIVQTLFRLLCPLRPKSVRDEVAVVIGASRGIGQAIAVQLGLLGAAVICVDVNSIGNESTVKQIRINGGHAFAYTCDVTSSDQVKHTIEAIERDISAVTMLFHCCGVPSPRSYTTNEPPAIQETINVSILSHFWIIDAILPRMKQRNYGHVVMLTSVAGSTGIRKQTPLTVSQYAVHGLFESTMEDLRSGRYKSIKMTLVYIYPFVISDGMEKDIRFRMPSYFGTMRAKEAAHQIIDGVRRNDVEVSIPKYWLWLGHLTRLMPRQAADALRDLMDTGLDFG